VTDADNFQTGAAGLARWPALPDAWSYSSLTDAEVCPRRWSLARASYPEVWEHSGYPRKLHVAALTGDVIHGALEDFLRAWKSASTTASPRAAAVVALRELGGYTALIERSLVRRVKTLQDNPRMARRAEELQAQLAVKVPDMRQKVQGIISRLHLDAVSGHGEAGDNRGPLSAGLHPEVDLVASALHFMGRADLIAVGPDGLTITDYKTGVADAGHGDQVRLYALLWQRDKERNPDGVLATKLTLAYSSHDELLDAPGPGELDELAHALSDRIAAVERDVAERPPPARPSAETCRYCAVRHLCEEFWVDLPHPEVRADRPTFRDYEGTVGPRNGPRSWMLGLDRTPGQLLLRTGTETPGFDTGDRVRILDIAATADDDTAQVVATITRASEVFVLTE
jgi:hypothetical protein